MGQRQPLIVLIHGIECCYDFLGDMQRREAVNRKPAILERFPDSSVIELTLFAGPEIRRDFPIEDWISQSAEKALDVLEDAAQGTGSGPIIFIANDIGVALAKQIILLTFNSGNTRVFAHRIFFAGYPKIDENVRSLRHVELILRLLLEEKSWPYSETFKEMLRVLPSVLYNVDCEFAAVSARYCPVYLPRLPLNFEISLPELNEAFLEIDGVIGREHTQLMPAYEAFLKYGAEVASELRKPALLREDIDLMEWILRDPTFRRWQKPDSPPFLLVSGPPESGKRIVSWSIPYLLDAQNQKRGNDQKELYLTFDFGHCSSRLEKEQNFLMSLIYQCLTLRPHLFRDAKVLCQTILGLRPGSISCDQLWLLLRRLLFASNDHRVFLIIVALDEVQGERVDQLGIFDGLLRLANNYTMSRKLRILLAGHAVETAPHEPLRIDLVASEEPKDAIQRSLASKLLGLSERLWASSDHLDKVTKNPFSSGSTFFDTMLRVVLEETTKFQSAASFSQALNSIKSINSTDGLYRLLFQSLGDLSMVKEALNWVFHATRPLTVSELSVAIALSPSHTLQSSAGKDTMKSLEDNLSWDIRRDLRGIIGKVIHLAGSTSNVYFTHDSFRQYFASCEDLYIPDFHSLITERCLAYISRVTKHEGGYSDAGRNSSRLLTFLNYADRNWTEHYKLSTHPNPLLEQEVITFLLGSWAPPWFERLRTNADAVLGAVEGNPLVMLVERGLANAVGSMRVALHPPLLKGWNSEITLQAAIWRGNLVIFERILPTVLPFLEPTFLGRCLQLASEYGRPAHANIILSNLDASYIDTLVKSNDSPCLIAAKSGHKQTLAALLKKLPEEAILQTDSSSRTVFHWAAQWGDADALRDLDSRKYPGAQILLADGENSTALHLAAASGSVEAVEFLLRRSNELVEMRNCNNLTALHLAVKEGHIPVVSTLIAAGASVWAGTKNDGDAIDLAAEAGHLPVFTLLLGKMTKSLGEKPREKGEWTESDESDDLRKVRWAGLTQRLISSLSLATRAGHTDIVSYILSKRFEYPLSVESNFLLKNFVDSTCNDTIKVFFSVQIDLVGKLEAGLISLAGAILARRADLVKYMVDVLAKRPLEIPTVNFQNGGNILHFAARKGVRAVVRELLQHPQADLLLKASDLSGDKPLDVAVTKGNEGAIKEILSAVKTRQPQSRTIFRAVEAKRVSIVKLLLDNGWKTDYRDGNANTLLHAAIDTGQDAIATLLFERGATNLLNQKNNVGDSLLHTAVSKKNKRIVRWLLDNGADPNALNPHTGLSPLHLLCKSGEGNIEEILEEFASGENSSRGTGGELRKKTDFSLPASDGSTALHYAIVREDPGLIRALLEKSLDLNAEVIETRATPLLEAVARGLDIEMIKLLLGPKGKVDVNKRDSQNKSALDIAIDRAEWHTVKELVEAGAEVNFKDIGNNVTPLYTAASKGNLQIVEFLLSKGADPKISGQNSLPAFQVALVRGREDIAKVILESDNFDVKLDSAGYSLGSHLHAALYTDAREIFSILIARGANANQSAPPFGKPIHLAVTSGYPFDEVQSLVKALVQIGAQVNGEDLSGRTALSLSVTEYPRSDITYLLNLDADPNLPDQLGATPLHYAAQVSDKNTIERLIRKGGDLQRKDNCNRSVLYRAAASGNYDTFITVLDNLPGNCRTEHLSSAIYSAIARRAADIVKAILDRTTINAYTRDRNGWTVLEVAEAYENQELVSQLRQGAGELLEVNLVGKIAPSTWNPDDMGPNIQLFEDNMGGFIEGTIGLLVGAYSASLRADTCMVPDPVTGISYFEVTILQASSVSVGFSEEYASVDGIVGLCEGSWGYKSDDGYAYWGDSSKGKVYGASYGMAARTSGEEAVVGCGVDFRNKVAFFTLDGENQGDVFDNIHGQLYPSVSLASGTEESRVHVNFGKQPFRYDLEERKIS